MKKISSKRFHNLHQIERLKTQSTPNHSQATVQKHSIDRFSCLDTKQNNITLTKFDFGFSRKSENDQCIHTRKRQSLLRNMLESSQRKRSQILNSLIKSKTNFLKKTIQITQKPNKMIRVKTEEKQPHYYPLSSARKYDHSKDQKLLNLSRLQTLTSSDQAWITERKRPLNKLSAKQSQFLRNSFNKRIKQIKSRKYFQKQNADKNNTNLIQAYGSTLKGHKHQQNQDSIYFSQGIYVLCDGHGSNGKHVSSFIAETVHNSLKQILNEGKIDENIILETYRKIDLELDHSNFDTSFSGCTCVAVIKHQQNLFCINLGDSKAIMAKGFNVVSLSKSHKPDIPTQKLRVQNYGGIVKPTQIGKDKFVGPMRIWAPGKNSWGPGLALSRAFGDKAARKYGVISVPQVKKLRVTGEQQFIVIGSDGLFDFFEDQQICSFVHKCLKEKLTPRNQIANHLVNEARKRWTSDSDDISCILIFL